jgi:hypothetical protein
LFLNSSFDERLIVASILSLQSTTPHYLGKKQQKFAKTAFFMSLLELIIPKWDMIKVIVNKEN